MGAWSEDMLGSDNALDALAVLCKIIYFNKEVGLYPLPLPTEDRKIKIIQFCLMSSEEKILKYKWENEDWPVIACAYLVTGTPIPPKLMEKAQRSCQHQIDNIGKLGWEDETKRIKVLLNHIKLLDKHEPGKISEIEHTGLFAKIWKVDHNL